MGPQKIDITLHTNDLRFYIVLSLFSSFSSLSIYAYMQFNKNKAHSLLFSFFPVFSFVCFIATWGCFNMVNPMILASLRMTQSLLLHPVTDKYSLSTEDDRVRVGASSMQGWRSTMEDAHCIKLDLGKKLGKLDDNCLLVAVFDGHCGPVTAQTCARNICNWLTSTPEFQNGKYEEALRAAYIKGDSSLHKMHPSDSSGCTGNSLLVVGNSLFCANCGDSRAVLCREGKAVPLSNDHKPTNPEEEQRIKRASMCVRANRVEGLLALSRAFGDFAFKDQSILPENQAITVVPDVKKVELTPLDEFVIVACDGVWDMMGNQAAVDFIRNELADHRDLSLACERLLNCCLAPTTAGFGTDNMTVVVLEFKGDFLQETEEEPPKKVPTPNGD